ncbi:MAG: ABC transporter ATP-binding protein [Alphaproteobacteria bacterium]|nr:ABC transporter ATP-binding protein [Alphaproteobacteria bacterium]
MAPRFDGATVVLSVDRLRTVFETAAQTVVAVDDVSFRLHQGEVLGLVGESGSGKSMTGHSIMGLVDPPGRIADGTILYRGEDLGHASEDRLREIRGNHVAMVFQDPMTSLSPTLSIGAQLAGVLRAHRRIGRREIRERSVEMLRRLDIPSPEARLRAYPHELSGGMRQRVCIAAAMLNEPDVLIADEPTTALDVTTQAQILEEVRDLCRNTGTAVIWISHDLAVIGALANRVAVMYAGQIVETGPVAELLAAPRHPYTRALLSAIPGANRGVRRLPQLTGEVPAIGDVPTGCRFRPRCARADAACEAPPVLVACGIGREVRCVHPLSDADATIDGAIP